MLEQNIYIKHMNMYINIRKLNIWISFLAQEKNFQMEHVGPHDVTVRIVQCEGVQKEGTSTSSLRGLLQFHNL